MDYLQQVGAAISMLLGSLAIFSPSTTEKFVSIKGDGKLGNSEIRATYGGFFVGIAAYALYSQQDVAFIALGVGWIGAAIVRAGTLIFGYYSHKNFAGVLFEMFIGILCLFGILGA
ncbi:hypothetical protein ACFO4O_15690 [Glaciecola siphonariae]|uniref:DUF4345 domain-containing protein n=1 Tax=Glaciecola siphonariae TaxID=521012 RepID=A0ABV9LYG8_9ALTE